METGINPHHFRIYIFNIIQLIIKICFFFYILLINNLGHQALFFPEKKGVP